MKILVLGKGYVGTAFCRCMSRMYDVTCLSKSELDYTDRAKLFMYLTKQSDPFAFVINTCGYTGRPNVDSCEDNKEDTWYYNVSVPVNIQKTCKDAGVRLIHISSGCIYDGYDKEFTEVDEPNFGLSSPDSSWYSKTKHACEMTLAGRDVYIFRIRMPFCETWSSRNILTKLIRYDNVINCKNSLTNIEDLCGYIMYFIVDILELNKPHPYGIYNVVNPQPIWTSDILLSLKKYNIGNPQWNQITLDQLYKTTKAKRSNCALSCEKITKIGLRLPDTQKSLDRAISAMADLRDLEDN